MTGGGLVAGDSKWTSVDSAARAYVQDAKDEFILMMRNQMRIASAGLNEDGTEADTDIPETAQTAAFNAVAPYFLSKPKQEVDHTHNVQHQIAATPLALTMLGLKSSKQVERLPDGTTAVHEVFAVDAELAEFTEHEESEG